MRMHTCANISQLKKPTLDQHLLEFLDADSWTLQLQLPARFLEEQLFICVPKVICSWIKKNWEHNILAVAFHSIGFFIILVCNLLVLYVVCTHESNTCIEFSVSQGIFSVASSHNITPKLYTSDLILTSDKEDNQRLTFTLKHVREERVTKEVDRTHFSSDGSLRRTSGAIHWG